MKSVKVISSKLAYAEDWVRIYDSTVQLHDGKRVHWYTPHLGESVIVIPIKGDYVYLTKEWRIAWKRTLVTAPAGDLGRSRTERQRLLHVRRELREEIGMDAKVIRKLGKLFLTARTNSTCHVYYASGLYRSELPRDEGEYIEVVKMPFKKAFRMFLSGELPTTSFNIAAFALALKREHILETEEEP